MTHLRFALINALKYLDGLQEADGRTLIEDKSNDALSPMKQDIESNSKAAT